MARPALAALLPSWVSTELAQQGFALGRGNPRQGQLQALARQDQVGHAGHFQAVEALGQLNQRSIATLAHGTNDLQHTLVDRVVGHAFPAQQMVQMLGEIGIGSVESANSDRSGHSGPHKLANARASLSYQAHRMDARENWL